MAYTVKDYEVNYEDKRFQDVKNAEAKELSDLEKTQADMLNQTDSKYQDLINESERASAEAQKNQQERTDFEIEKINQQKEQAHKDYIKEQAGAYGDWQKQSNQYGANAEKMAAQGLGGSGYSESSQVSMYNTYQIRVATARQAYELAKLNYDNGIQEAKLQNNVALAEIKAKALQQQLELSLQGLQYKNQLLLDFTDRKTAVKSRYYDQWKDVLAQLNTENALAENQRQFKAEYDLQEAVKQAAITAGSGGGGGGGSTSRGSSKKYTSAADVKSTISAANGNTSNAGDNLPVDIKSVSALGYGPISAAKLNALVNSGEVIRYVEDGKQKFRKAGTNPKNTKNTTNTTTAPRVTAAPTATSKNTALAPFTTRARS